MKLLVIVILLVCLLLQEVKNSFLRYRSRRRRSAVRGCELGGNCAPPSDDKSTIKIEVIPVEVCKFKMSKKCCTAPSFGDCPGVPLIGSTTRTSFTKTYKPICELRAAIYGGKKACIPENLAEMLTIADIHSNSQCYPMYTFWCNNELDDNKEYLLNFMVPEDKVDETTLALMRQGHSCHKVDEQTIKCYL